jgi:hypothetical protein
LAGIGAALCMTSKYWSIFLIAGLVLAALVDSRRTVYFRSAAPWITIVTGIAILSPHIGWLEKHNFSPFDYAMAVHGGRSFAQAFWADIEYLVDSAAFVALPVAVVLLTARPRLGTVIEMAWPKDPERRLVAAAFWGTLILPTLPALLWGVQINGLWSMSGWTLLPIMLLSSKAIEIPDTAVRPLVGLAAVIPLLLLLIAPGVAVVRQWQGVPPELAHSRMLAAQVEDAWRGTTSKPLRYIGGNLAQGVVTYVSSRPELMPDFPEWHGKRVAEAGIALVCLSNDVGCITSSSSIASTNPESRRIETELARTFLGFHGLPAKYVIFVVPPV